VGDLPPNLLRRALPVLGRLYRLAHDPRAIEELRERWANSALVRGRAAAQEGRWADALRLLEQARRERPWPDENLDADLNEIRAIRRLQQRLAARPNDPLLLVQLGRALMGQEQGDEALECFRRAVAVAPTYAEAHAMIALELHYRGDLEGARVAYEEALRLDPAQPLARLYYPDLQRGEPLGTTLLAITSGQQPSRPAAELPETAAGAQVA